MKMSLFKGAFVGVLIAGQSLVLGDQITLSTSSHSYGNGGEFTATPDSGLAYLLDNYSPSAKVGSGFETFCIEYNEYFTPGGTYMAGLSAGSIAGGVGGASNGTDPVSIGTAWLYDQFAAGTLPNYFVIEARRYNAGLLQQAFWFLEDEIVLTQSQIAANTFLSSAIALFGEVGAKADNNGAYAVGALNLTTASGGPVQDQLVRFSVPDGGTTLALLGLGLAALAGFGRRGRN